MTAMYDIERTEVVKGPQGTLFGRNSIAGAVSVITKKPEPDFAASAELTLADWDHVEANAMVNVPLGDQWALRVAGYVLDNKGFLKNDQGGDKLGFHQISAGRVSLARDGDNFDATLTAAYEALPAAERKRLDAMTAVHSYNFMRSLKYPEAAPLSQEQLDRVKDVEHPYEQVKPFHWFRGYQVGGKSLIWGRATQRWSKYEFVAPEKQRC